MFSKSHRTKRSRRPPLFQATSAAAERWEDATKVPRLLNFHFASTCARKSRHGSNQHENITNLKEDFLLCRSPLSEDLYGK